MLVELEEAHINLDKNCELDLFVPSGQPYFKPNQVTNTIAKNAKINPGDRVFEIGAGIGGLTILLVKYHPQLERIYSVEIVSQQVEAARENIKKENLENKVVILQGSLFEPIKEYSPQLKANVIVGDCSGMTTLGQELGWYPPQTEAEGGIPLGGDDGTSRVIPFLEQSPTYLLPQGRTYFPVSPNFSDKKKILDVARSLYKNVELAEERKMPLTEKYIKIIDNSKSKKFCPIEKRGSRGHWTLEVYEASSPINQ